MHEKPPRPPKDFMMDGPRPTERFRIRTVGFFYAVVEQLWEHRDGTSEWKRVWSPVEFEGRQL
jgi:hypothetical protein